MAAMRVPGTPRPEGSTTWPVMFPPVPCAFRMAPDRAKDRRPSFSRTFIVANSCLWTISRPGLPCGDLFSVPLGCAALYQLGHILLQQISTRYQIFRRHFHSFQIIRPALIALLDRWPRVV